MYAINVFAINSARHFLVKQSNFRDPKSKKHSRETETD